MNIEDIIYPPIYKVTSQMRKQFAEVRKKVHNIVKQQPNQITLEEAKEQIKKYEQ